MVASKRRQIKPRVSWQPEKYALIGHVFTRSLRSLVSIFYYRMITNGYSSLPRSSSAQSGFLSTAIHNSVARSRSSASLASDHTPKRPPSVASTTASSSGTSRRSRPKPKTVNASLSIWQIQKELKRGEMVQVIKSKLSRIPHSYTNSRILWNHESQCFATIAKSKSPIKSSINPALMGFSCKSHTKKLSESRIWIIFHKSQQSHYLIIESRKILHPIL